MELHFLLLISLLPTVFGMIPRDERSRCRCVGHIKCINHRKIQNVQVIPKSYSCKNTEIIVTTNSTQVCLDHKAPQGKAIINCWEMNEQTTRKLQQCLKKNWNLPKRKCRRKRKKPKS